MPRNCVQINQCYWYILPAVYSKFNYAFFFFKANNQNKLSAMNVGTYNSIQFTSYNMTMVDFPDLVQNSSKMARKTHPSTRTNVYKEVNVLCILNTAFVQIFGGAAASMKFRIFFLNCSKNFAYTASEINIWFDWPNLWRSSNYLKPKS